MPVLLISADLDPVTPPDFGRRAAQFLTQSLHLVMPYASHEDGSPCIGNLADEFLLRGTAKGLDTSCLSQLKRIPFLLELPKEGIRPFG